MSMKRVFLFLLIIAISLYSVFAWQNTYRLSSDEVQNFLLLRKVSSTITPDPTYPISASQLSALVKSLDTSKLSGKYLDIYNDLINELDHPEVIVSSKNHESGINLNVSVLGMQYIQGLDIDTYKILPYKDRKPLFDIKTDIYMSEYAFGLFDFGIHTKSNLDKSTNKFNYSIYDFFTNSVEKSENYPNSAYGSFGFDNFNLTVGRDRLGNGNGYTGNLVLGENNIFQDFMKISYANDLFSYDFTINSFNCEDKEKSHSVIDALTANKKNIYLHRFSFNVLNYANISLYEGALVYSKYVFSNIQLFNPFMIFHNTGSYYDASTNNFFGIESLVNIPKFDLYVDAQVLFDQIVLKGEDPQKTGEFAFISLLNLSNTKEFKYGILDTYAEVVYGNPYVYLKNKHGYGISDIADYKVDNYDLVSDIYTDFNDKCSQDLQYLGYKYGGDLFTIAFGSKYQKDKFKISADIQYLAKGDNGIRDGETREANGEIGIPEITYMINVGLDYNFYKGFDVSGKAAYLRHNNYHHNSNKLVNDLQFALSVNIKPMELLDKWFMRDSL